MLSASIKEHNLEFRFAAGTSRGTLHTKKVYYLILKTKAETGIGECSLIPGLSYDDKPGYAEKINEVCNAINAGEDFRALDLSEHPSISFGLETALLDIKANGSKNLFPGNFTGGSVGIPINGLIWMGNKEFMKDQIHQKIETGFRCIKLKIGAIDFETELEIIQSIRKSFLPADLEIRLDANGAFSPDEALQKLNRLARFNIHSIEQPVKAGEWDTMAAICARSPIPIALDEELIGINSFQIKENLLSVINPAYIILKPGLLGGMERAREWIDIAGKKNIGWWITSALESNIGLNAIAQWTATLNTTLPQGLGTGQLYSNNIPSPLTIRKDHLYYLPGESWDLSAILS